MSFDTSERLVNRNRLSVQIADLIKKRILCKNQGFELRLYPSDQQDYKDESVPKPWQCLVLSHTHGFCTSNDYQGVSRLAYQIQVRTIKITPPDRNY